MAQSPDICITVSATIADLQLRPVKCIISETCWDLIYDQEGFMLRCFFRSYDKFGYGSVVVEG